ncbi:MAG: hypothetical protein ACFFEO_01650 [Candidatus Thorarchaeota archaeon]
MNLSEIIILILKVENQLSSTDDLIGKELFLEKFEKLSLKVEQLTEEITKLKNKLDKANLINRSFGLSSIRNSQSLSFAKDVIGIGSPSKRYILSIRAITEEWKDRKNDIFLVIRQQDKETHMDIKALGVRIPLDDTKNIELLAKQVLSLLFISCELKSLELNEILRDIFSQVNREGTKLVQEIKEKMILH